jgi:hypothetical protein
MMLPRNTGLSKERTICGRIDKSHMESSLSGRSRHLCLDLRGHSQMNDGARKRDGNDAHEKPGHELSVSAPSTKSAFERSSPGILVFSNRRHLGHINQRALELTGHLDQAETGPSTMTLSMLVSELRVQIQVALDNRRKGDIWELFELKRDIVEAGRKIRLRGFGIADQRSQDNSRIVIVLDEFGFRQATTQVRPSQSRSPIIEEPTP